LKSQQVSLFIVVQILHSGMDDYCGSPFWVNAEKMLCRVTEPAV